MDADPSRLSLFPHSNSLCTVSNNYLIAVPRIMHLLIATLMNQSSIIMYHLNQYFFDYHTLLMITHRLSLVSYSNSSWAVSKNHGRCPVFRTHLWYRLSSIGVSVATFHPAVILSSIYAYNQTISATIWLVLVVFRIFCLILKHLLSD